jgi:putative iron-regulated protein
MKYARLSFVGCLLFLSTGLFVSAQDVDIEALQQDAMQTYAEIVFASYEDSLTAAVELQDAIETFLAEPSEETLAAARESWLASNEPYGQTEAYRFYGGPIDDEDGPEGLLNAWPLDEAYIDYVEGDADAGIINNVEDYPEIDADLLISLNEVGAEENISTGYHAIEFLLWGQDLSADSAGTRPYTDYTEAVNADRRAAYLSTAAELLVSDLESLVADWRPDEPGNYRESFLASDPDDAFTNMLTGAGVLATAELAGERMFVAYDNQDQEDEHSCFSDNTHRDIITNFMGVSNVYQGTYTRLDGTVIEGTGIADVIEATNPELNADILATLDNATQMTDDIVVPFDNAIVLAESRPQVLETVFVLQDLGDLLAQAGTELGLSINTALPE